MVNTGPDNGLLNVREWEHRAPLFKGYIHRDFTKVLYAVPGMGLPQAIPPPLGGPHPLDSNAGSPEVAVTHAATHLHFIVPRPLTASGSARYGPALMSIITI